MSGITRATFITRSALGAAALTAAGPARALAHAKHGAFGGGDMAIVNFALTLEKVEADFYKRALAVKDLDERARKLLEAISKDETAHVDQLAKTLQALGGKADPAPQTRFPALTSQDQVLQLAIELEDSGVAVYNGAATAIQSRDVLQAAASIAQVEARHAGALRELAGQLPVVGPFDRVLSGEQADAAVHEFTA
ncbi:MAG: ferritin-like domain-containing protein [Actinomycetota bacterium]|nr:ferritin-like domain-containing protein [Actinomycetota bacterium]